MAHFSPDRSWRTFKRSLLNHYVLKYEEFYLQDQTYLKPHPLELKLRNHA